jgi:transcriptional/translational regulatory protein YebC/TACO1
MFAQKGVIRLEGYLDEERLLDASLEGGAQSYEISDDEDNPGAEVFTDIANLEILNQTLQMQGFVIAEVELRWIPNNTIEVTDSEQARSLFKLIDALESLDDVQTVTANLAMSEDLISVSALMLS